MTKNFKNFIGFLLGNADTEPKNKNFPLSPLATTGINIINYLRIIVTQLVVQPKLDHLFHQKSRVDHHPWKHLHFYHH